MQRLLIALFILVIGTAVAGTAMAVDGSNGLDPAAVEPKTSAVDELADDPEAGLPPTYAPKRAGDGPPTYVPGRAEIVSPTSEIGRNINPSQDPTVRICKNPDGTYAVIHTTPAPGKDPYPDDDPEDLRSRPC